LLDPTEGSVTLDGLDLRHVRLRDLRRRMGFVPQETFLFGATVAENIAMGVSSASRREIAEVAEIAGLAPDLASFPKGLDTVVGERGITLSGGQKQRVAVARALIRDPRILILDDAFASVDTATEARILAGLREVLPGRTTILISHRVNTVRLADRIFVLQRGRLCQQGSHESLVAQPGYYADLCAKQLAEVQVAMA
jgi:ATP-binding cassette subfamily B protein